MNAHPECTCAHCTRPVAPRRWALLLGLAALVVAGGVAGSLTTVWATHDFPDVPESSPHHDDISWLVAQGITSGFGDGTFKPQNPVARQQMASFLRRYNAGFHLVSADSTAASGTIHNATASCAAGERAIAGGGTTNHATAAMTDSFPLEDGVSWRVRWFSNAAFTNNDVTTWVLCGPAA